jgi:hypothetical protein
MRRPACGPAAMRYVVEAWFRSAFADGHAPPDRVLATQFQARARPGAPPPRGQAGPSRPAMR